MENEPVLVSVLRREKDLKALLEEGWYRIPEENMPKRSFQWLAFYQTSGLPEDPSSIRYYAKIKNSKKVKRYTLLPDEPDHPGAENTYIKFNLEPVKRLNRKIKNKTGMKVVFSFTDYQSLTGSRYLHTLLGHTPLEPVMRRILRKIGLPLLAEYSVPSAKGTYRLDFALLCKFGKIDIECDSISSHSSRTQKEFDEKRDILMRKKGWTVLRFDEENILRNQKNVLGVILDTVSELGGIKE